MTNMQNLRQCSGHDVIDEHSRALRMVSEISPSPPPVVCRLAGVDTGDYQPSGLGRKLSRWSAEVHHWRHQSLIKPAD